MTTEFHPVVQMNGLIPCFRKVVKGFRDNGVYSLTLHFYQGGLRAHRILDSGDKKKVKKGVADFLQAWGKPHFTGQVSFYLKHGEFTDRFDAYPGSGSFNPHMKDGIAFEVVSFREDYSDPLQFRIDEIREIEAEIPF